MSASTSTPTAFAVRGAVPMLVRAWRGPAVRNGGPPARRADGSVICLSDLPAPGVRWTRRRKRAVVECVEHGLIPADAACRRYDLTVQELAEWRATAARGDRAPAAWIDRPRPIRRGTVTAGALRIDLDRLTVRLGDRTVAMSPSEWRILAAIAEADGAVVSTAMLMGALYDHPEPTTGPKIADVLLCRLRKRLGPEAGRIIAIWGRGYRLDVN